MTALLAAYGVLVAVAWLRHALFAMVRRGTPEISPASPGLPADDCPTVTILVPAKDESRGLERCLRALLAQDYPAFDILVVDDRSVDDTAAIARRVAADDPRVKLLQVSELPAGWTGKTHALHLAQAQAQGEWLLFVDADATLQPSCLRLALADALRHRADMLSLLPSFELASFWEWTVQPPAAAYLMAMYPVGMVNDPSRQDMGFANGQFILVRRSAYDAIGGHASVRAHFVEDIHLGRRIRRAGLGLRLAMAPDLLRVRMYASLGEIVRGWSRILYSAVDHKPGKLLALLLFTFLFTVSSYVALLAGAAWCIAAPGDPRGWVLLGLGALHETAQTALMGRIYQLTRSPLRALWLRPLSAPILIWVLLRTLRLCRTHAVTWRGTRYGAELAAAPPAA